MIVCVHIAPPRLQRPHQQDSKRIQSLLQTYLYSHAVRIVRLLRRRFPRDTYSIRSSHLAPDLARSGQTKVGREPLDSGCCPAGAQGHKASKHIAGMSVIWIVSFCLQLIGRWIGHPSRARLCSGVELSLPGGKKQKNWLSSRRGSLTLFHLKLLNSQVPLSVYFE